jgi:hypothetical protein
VPFLFVTLTINTSREVCVPNEVLNGRTNGRWIVLNSISFIFISAQHIHYLLKSQLLARPFQKLAGIARELFAASEDFLPGPLS